MSRHEILVFSPYYLPYSSTGPVQTIASMVSQLNEDFRFRIFTSNRGARDDEEANLMEVGEWNEAGAAEVYYSSPEERSWSQIFHVLREIQYDILYLNTFWHLDFGMKPLLLNRVGLLPGKPIVLARRGQFSSGAMEIKGWKKHPCAWFMREIGIGENVIWQASTEGEKKDIRNVMGEKKKIIVAKDPPSVTETVDPKCWGDKKEGEIDILFLSRVDPMKNLMYVLDVISDMKEPIRMKIAGPISDREYWLNCKKKMENIRENIDIE